MSHELAETEWKGMPEFVQDKQDTLNATLAEQTAQTATYTCGVCGVSMQMEQPAQRKQVGDSRFESWFSEDYDPKGKGTKQQMREAYEAGMNDPSPPAQRKPLTDEQTKDIRVAYGSPLAIHMEFARAIEAAHGIKE